MQQPTRIAEHPDAAPITYDLVTKRPLEGLQHEQGWPSKRVCARQAGRDTVPGEQLQQQQADLPGRCHQYSLNSNEPQPRQHQLQGDNLGQQLGTAGHHKQQVTSQPQPIDANATGTVRVVPCTGGYTKVGHRSRLLVHLC